MLTIVIAFFWISILLYILLGGADFGAGILEIFSSSANKARIRSLTYHTIGPVWEANHMWLIIAVVILFVAFPSIYTSFTTYLHIPVLLLLIGIIARGTAFIFRHYDAYQDGESQKLYNFIFMLSSLFTSFILGIIGGAMISHHIPTQQANFLDTYIFSWISPFTIATGVLGSLICTFLAATYLIGESEVIDNKEYFRKKSFRFSIVVFIWGGLALLVGRISGIPFISQIIHSPLSLISFILSGISFLYYWKILSDSNKWRLRIAAGAVITFMLGTAAFVIHPEIMTFSDKEALSFYNSAAPDLTIKYLGWALLIGSIFIIPGIVHLIVSFQVRND